MTAYVKSKKGYEQIEFDAAAVREAYKKQKREKKFPTSINLPESTVAQLKDMAQKRGIPYQTLMRMFIVEGLEKFKKSA